MCVCTIGDVSYTDLLHGNTVDYKITKIVKQLDLVVETAGHCQFNQV